VLALVVANPGADCTQVDFAKFRGDPTVREAQAKLIDECDSVMGRNRLEVRGLLGTPDSVTPDNETWHVTSSKRLDLTYGKDDSVVTVAIKP
jgi:hypothetical protein